MYPGYLIVGVLMLAPLGIMTTLRLTAASQAVRVRTRPAEPSTESGAESSTSEPDDPAAAPDVDTEIDTGIDIDLDSDGDEEDVAADMGRGRLPDGKRPLQCQRDEGTPRQRVTSRPRSLEC